jgi:predicted component of type VI protein secretion system
MKLSLEVLSPGPSKGKIVPVPRSPFIIGRDPKCHLRPSSAMVSQLHCSLEVRNQQVIVKDLGSMNGTFVNDQQVEEKALGNGDRLRIGPLTFSLRVERLPSVDKPTPVPLAKPKVLGDDDDEVAAVLLAIRDDRKAPPGTTILDGEEIPAGGTQVMAALPPSAEEGAADGEPGTADQPPGAGKAATAKLENTSSAAEQLLMKYLRRPRKTT